MVSFGLKEMSCEDTTERFHWLLNAVICPQILCRWINCSNV